MPRPKKPPAPPPKTHSRKWTEGTVTEVRPGHYRAFRARVHNADGTSSRPSKMFTDRQQAESWARGDVEPAALYLGAWLERWLALQLPSLAPNARTLYRYHVKAAADLGRRPLASLTVDDWQAHANLLLGRWARSTVARWRSIMGSAMRAAIPAHLTENLLPRVRLPKPDERPPRAWTQAEVDRLLATAAGDKHEPWLLFSLGCGVRLGEARALYWADVDLAARTATIRASLGNNTNERGPTKTRRVRVVDIPDGVIPVLAELRKRQPARQRLVFGRTDNQRAYGARSYRYWLEVRCRRAEIPTWSPHSLRHTCASLALDANPPVPVQDIAHLLGHSVETCQRVYAHYIGQGQRRAAVALGAALSHRFSGPKLVDGSENGSAKSF